MILLASGDSAGQKGILEAQRVTATAYGYELVHLRAHGMRGSQRLVYGPAADGAHIVGGEHAPAQYVPPMPVGPARVTPGIHRRTPCGTLCIPCRAIVRIVRRRTWRTRQCSPDNGTGTLITASRRSALSVILSVMVGGIMHLPLDMRKPRTKGGAELMRYVSFVILHTHLSLFSVPDICRTLNESLAIQQSLKLLFSLYQVIDHISQGKTP